MHANESTSRRLNWVTGTEPRWRLWPAVHRHVRRWSFAFIMSPLAELLPGRNIQGERISIREPRDILPFRVSWWPSAVSAWSGSNLDYGQVQINSVSLKGRVPHDIR